MTHQVNFTKLAEAQLASIPKVDMQKIAKRIEKLSLDPFPVKCEKLSGLDEPIYRVRQGDYRILYSVFEDSLIVLIVKIGHRKEVYRH